MRTLCSSGARAGYVRAAGEFCEGTPELDDEELAPELYAIAAPVRNEAREVVAAVNLAADASTISLAELVDALTPHLISTADRISARLGYRCDDE